MIPPPRAPRERRTPLQAPQRALLLRAPRELPAPQQARAPLARRMPLAILPAPRVRQIPPRVAQRVRRAPPQVRRERPILPAPAPRVRRIPRAPPQAIPPPRQATVGIKRR